MLSGGLRLAPARRAWWSLSSRRYAGHNKWSKIRHKKGDNDTKRALQLSKVSREIIACAKAGGADPQVNSQLNVLLAKARSLQMPKASMESALRKGQGGGAAGGGLQSFTYEGTAHGASFIVETLTDNSNRAVQDVRHAFTKSGGGLASVRHMFARRGVVQLTMEQQPEEAQDVSEEQVMATALDVDGVEDVVRNEDGDVDIVFDVLCAPEALAAVTQALQQASAGRWMVTGSELTWQAQDEYRVPPSEDLDALVERLDGIEDVVRVWHT
ncbi:hypothetical protein RI367_004998 [Sorochytrium milnesiophthora]